MNRNFFLLCLLGTVLAGCGTSGGSTSAVSDTKPAAESAQTEADSTEQASDESGNKADDEAAKTEEVAKVTEDKATIIREKGKTSRQGTYVRAIVNGQPITNNDVARRAAFLRLRRVQGNRNEKALEELVEQALKMQEARRTNSLASQEQVDAAFANFAKNNKVPTNILTRELGRMGITAKHFKDYIHSQMSWNRTVGRRFSAETRQVSEKDAIFQLKETGSAKPETTEYLVKQIVFVVPEAKRGTLLNARRTEATAFRQRFTSCDQAVTLAKELRDVAVVDRGRVLEPELPPEWKDEVVAAPVGKTTKPLTTSKGIELIAVCSKRNVSDDRAAQVISQSKAFEDFNKNRGGELEKRYYDELRSRARIILR